MRKGSLAFKTMRCSDTWWSHSFFLR